ncbi:GNAT family N-acetyltransferase [Pedobacter sp. P351]|uniref:GNAT family N-acetyltransferase n=1 Tax=Pedobacter superstes TaxID=3133441 RepID=UPI00309B1C11
MNIRLASSNDIFLIHQLANAIWHSTYKSILPIEQIEFMLSKMYSIESLQSQLDEGITFIFAEAEGKALAFASYSLSDSQQFIYKIHKLYILPEEQGKGLGTHLTNFIKRDARAKGGKILELNVNRNNPAQNFYRKYGFEVFEEVDIPYYQYTLNDYVMRMIL